MEGWEGKMWVGKGACEKRVWDLRWVRRVAGVDCRQATCTLLIVPERKAWAYFSMCCALGQDVGGHGHALLGAAHHKANVDRSPHSIIHISSQSELQHTPPTQQIHTAQRRGHSLKC